jgi:SnoaL-like protein
VRRTLVALTIATAFAGAVARGADPDLSLLQQRVDRLEALTQRVEAISAIKRLQHSYGHYAELGLWHDFADLFADTGIGYYTQGALDREGIRKLFLNDVGGGQVGLKDGRIYPHISMQPVITLAADGQSAKGRWHIMAMLGGYQTTASWSGGVYENQYVRENGVWKMKEVRYFQQYSGRYEAPGWTATKDQTAFDFDGSSAGKPIPDVPPSVTGGLRLQAEANPTLTALATRLADLSARARRLNDEIEVTNLQHQYGYFLDRRMWDDVAKLFAAEGTMEIGQQGVYVGQRSIRRGLSAFDPPVRDAGQVNDHVHLQTIVTVSPDSRTARARGTELGMTTAAGRALWSQSIYENEFVRQNGVWKFKTMHVYPRFIVDAEQGWAKDAQPAPGPSRTFPPDKPPTEKYEIYPRFHIAPLHFAHPVTGRAPQYPEGVVSAFRRPADLGSAFSRTDQIPKTAAALESLLTATERSVARSKAYHASENITTAYGYAMDDSKSGPNFLMVHQIVQPVITVSADGRSSKIRARLFQLGGPAGGEGSWASGIYENAAVDENGRWKLSTTTLRQSWTAPSRGGWVRVTTPP